jgi:hypothetical protein
MLLLSAALATSFVVATAIIALAWLVLAVARIDDLHRHGVYRGAKAITRISIGDAHSAKPDAGWRLGNRAHQWFGPATVISGRAMGFAVWLHLRDQFGRRRSVCVPADSMSGQMFRRLRVAANSALGQ